MKNAFSVNPVRVVATAIKKVTKPKVAWTGTRAARRAAVRASQHNRIRKLKKPTTNCEEVKFIQICLCWSFTFLLHCVNGQIHPTRSESLENDSAQGEPIVEKGRL